MIFSGAYGTTLLAIIVAMVAPFTVFLKLWKSNEYSRSRKQHKGEAQNRAILPSPCRLLPSWFGFLGGHTLLISKSEQGFDVGDGVVCTSALSTSDALGQEAKVGSAQRVVVARARAPRDTAAQYCLEYFDIQHPDLEPEKGARLVIQFEGIVPEAAPGVAYAPVDLDGQVSAVVDVPSPLSAEKGE